MVNFSADDFRFMARAIQLADEVLISPHPNPRVGCVIVNNGEIVGEGWHEAAGRPHAEVHALAKAAERARGATAYVTLEPCCHHGRTPPCTDALLAAGVHRVVAAVQDPNPRVAGQGIQRLRESGVHVDVGLMESQANALNAGFMKRMQTGLPWVRCKLAMSLDGRTAMATGESQWITAPTARRDVQKVRARSSAILTGIGTVLADDPFLNLRSEELGLEPSRQPVRVVVDSQLRIPANARMLAVPGQTWIATTSKDTSKRRALIDTGAEILILPEKDGGVDLLALMAELGKREINELLVEAGSRLNGALLQSQLIDEVIFYMAPILMGDSAKGLFELPGLGKMAQRKHLSIQDIRAVGPDWRITAKPIYG